MIGDGVETAVVIVGYKNADDIVDCLAALSRAVDSPRFDVFICENGGRNAYDSLIQRLQETVCEACGPNFAIAPFLEVRRFRLASRRTCVTIGCAAGNLGYGGGVNAWLRVLLNVSGWKGIWVLNPDAEPAPNALAALVDRAETGGKGMVGSTILEAGSDDTVRFRGGLAWRRSWARSVAIGLGEPLDAPVDLPTIERAMESPSGASMYVTRRCIERIGLMDESLFLFFEDLDWGARAKELGLGYARESVIRHKRGTTTGSAGRAASMSKLAVYLQHRNAIHFVRRHYPRTLPVRIVMSIAFSLRFLLNGAPGNCLAALSGMSAGVSGEKGAPSWHS